MTGEKKRKPPTFPYLPKSRGEHVCVLDDDSNADIVQAHRLKKSWIEDHKIRSKWKTQKRKEGLTNQTSAPVKDISHHAHDEIVVDSKPDTSPKRPDNSPTPTSSLDKSSLRDLRKLAYASKPSLSQKPHPSRPRRTSGRSQNNWDGKDTTQHETGQPNMKLRMNVLLEKIKRDFS